MTALLEAATETASHAAARAAGAEAGSDPDASRHVVRLTLEYDGTAFSGWQRQPDRRTVEGVLRAAVRAACGEEPVLTASGRTDAGAHAHGQVVGCALRRAWDPERLARAVNAHLPDDAAVVAAEPAPAGFHARFDAVSRTYRYAVVPRAPRLAVLRRYAWRVDGPLDVEAMRRAGASLVGTHDFGAFGRAPRPGGGTVRTVHRVVVTPADRGILIEVTADAFLRGMMRAFAATLVAAGRGALTATDVERRLAAPSAGHRLPAPAPAHGLHQWSVAYPVGPR